MRIIETKVFLIGEHPNKEKCFDWIRDNWHDLNNHSGDEIVASFKALQEIIGGNFDYSICAVPDRGEYIKFTDYDRDELCRISAGDYPLTGVCWDYDVITGLREGNPEKVLESYHTDTKYIYSDEGLLEMCEANGYEFDEEGNCI